MRNVLVEATSGAEGAPRTGMGTGLRGHQTLGSDSCLVSFLLRQNNLDGHVAPVPRAPGEIGRGLAAAMVGSLWSEKTR